MWSLDYGSWKGHPAHNTLLIAPHDHFVTPGHVVRQSLRLLRLKNPYDTMMLVTTSADFENVALQGTA